jgi:hypothetical protein
MAQPRSGRPQKLTEWDRRVSTITVCWELHEMVSMACGRLLSQRSPCAMPSIGWSGVYLAAIGLWSSGNAFSALHHLAIQRTNLGLADARRTVHAPMYSANCSLVMSKTYLGLFFMVWARPLSSSEGKS